MLFLALAILSLAAYQKQKSKDSLALLRVLLEAMNHQTSQISFSL
jgi:hypothetical protein